METEAPAATLGDGPAVEGVSEADAEGAAVVDGEGAGPPQAATRMTRTTHHAIAPFDLIGQRYVADVRADPHRTSPSLRTAGPCRSGDVRYGPGRVTRKHRFLPCGARTQPSG
jgi:hypothetical protein